MTAQLYLESEMNRFLGTKGARGREHPSQTKGDAQGRHGVILHARDNIVNHVSISDKNPNFCAILSSPPKMTETKLS